ncbi:hypothetical protein EWM64_g6610 [Hericium alpestre]|uniref:Uncharacterized protein n=1 Tax=Hericium alpestre TaxID=135208 RepID=A0A4Y9ZU88_9AGAM|nr:hypothetical protein EWM64_g6610 [Hericium alpestre]
MVLACVHDTIIQLVASVRLAAWPHLTSSCFMDVSGSKSFYVYDAAFLESRNQSFLRAFYCSNKCRVHLCFPQDTRGFLYFHQDAQNPLQSQIRFRIAQDRDPTRSFTSGHDLTYGSGYTWNILLVNATSKNPALRTMLLRDGLVDDALLAQLQARSESNKHSLRLKRVVSALSHPFTLEFKKRTLHLAVHVAGQDRMYSTRGPLFNYIRMLQGSVVYEEGSASCRLERSTLPQHAGRRIVVMRLLKILHPPKRRPELPPTGGVSIPAEGELFKSWCRDVDKPGRRGQTLRLLYDAPGNVEQPSDRSP